MPETIDSDTTWSGRVVLDDDVEIAAGVTLTIAKGTEVVGNGFDIVGAGSIKARSVASAPILFQDTYINPTGDENFDGGSLSFRFVEFAGDTTVATGARVDLTIDACLFGGTTFPVRLWEPRNGSITNSIFLDSFGVSVTAASDFVFSENFVRAQRVFEGSSYALESWGTGRVESTGNAFMAGDRVALRAGAPQATIDSLGDYFAGDPETLIDDAADDPDRGVVELRHPDPTPNDALARTITTWNSLTLPSVVFRDATLCGETAAFLVGNSLSNRLTGNSAANRLIGGDGGDTLTGRGGADDVRGDAGRDRLRGGTGADSMDGGGGDDTVLSGTGADRLFGGDGDDLLAGAGDGDSLSGGVGSDRIVGGPGDDVLVGGADADRFDIDTARFGIDRVSDFADGDEIVVTTDALTAADLVVATRDDDVLVSFGGPGMLILVNAAAAFAPTDIVFA